MKTALNHSSRGLRRAQAQVNIAASRIARWGVTDHPTNQTTDVREPAGVRDEMRFDGRARPRDELRQRWGAAGGELKADVDLNEEAIRLKTGEIAFRANIAATRSVLDMERSLSEMLDEEE